MKLLALTTKIFPLLILSREAEQEAINVIRRHRRSGKSYARIADYLNSQGIPTKRGKQWSAMQVQRVVARLKVS